MLVPMITVWVQVINKYCNTTIECTVSILLYSILEHPSKLTLDLTKAFWLNS